MSIIIDDSKIDLDNITFDSLDEDDIIQNEKIQYLYECQKIVKELSIKQQCVNDIIKEQGDDINIMVNDFIIVNNVSFSIN